MNSQPAGAAQPHHALPNCNWVTFYIRKPGDVEHATGLLCRSYDLAMTRKAKSRAGTAPLAA